MDQEDESETTDPMLANLRARHDGFTPKRQKKFLKALGKTGCVRDACRKAGISSTSAYRTRARLPGFAALWDSAQAMAATELETVAWQRAVEGVEEKVFAYGKEVGTRVKRSDGILRLLLMASNPDKYGRMGAAAGAVSEAQMRKLREEIEQEVRDEIYSDEKVEEARESIMRKLGNLRRKLMRDGWVEDVPGGSLVREGWAPVTPEAIAAHEARQARGAEEA